MISDQELYNYSLTTLFLITPLTVISLLFTTAPYGKHIRPGWGPTIPPPIAWFFMESPTLFLTLLLFPFGNNSHNPRAYFLISPFLIHYTHRTCIYPLKLFLRTNNKTNKKQPGFPLSIALTAFLFNCLNGYLQARWVSEYAKLDTLFFWLRFVVGFVIFVIGMFVNVWSDNVLIGLKEMSGGGYRVPKGGLFDLVSVPNYFGEIVEWFGWAVMNCSWAGFGFFLYTCANLVPRAGATHKWYLDKFGEDYPKNRKAVIPFVF